MVNAMLRYERSNRDVKTLFIKKIILIMIEHLKKTLTLTGQCKTYFKPIRIF
jgi:hypothetical protein